MSMLNRKLRRDLMRLWAQCLAISLVLAAGAATLILGAGAHDSLFETRAAYYDQHRFADVFTQVRRAPDYVRERIAHIPGVASVETRIFKHALLDIEGMREPASAVLISLPVDHGQQHNLLYIRSGRLPQPHSANEAAVSEGFANAHGFTIGSRLSVLLNGRKRALTITGIVLSPEFIYALGPGDLIPDDRRFAVVWMSQTALEAAYDLEGVFNSVTVKLLHGASQPAVTSALDAIMERYGGHSAHGRSDQQSHAFLDAELQQLQALTRILPPVFLGISAFLINIVLVRLIALEREQIGLLKALGYGRVMIAWHYLKLVLAIAALGIAIGAVAGTWLGRTLAEFYGDFFRFPFLIFIMQPKTYAIAGGVCVLAAAAGAVRAVYQAVSLPPAVAMRPPAPPRYHRIFASWFKILEWLPGRFLMVMRQIMLNPLRSLFTTLGIALAGALLVASLFAFDAMDFMIDITFFQQDRQDATITFNDEQHRRVVDEVERLPGVLRVEPFRAMPARLSLGARTKDITLLGKPRKTDLSRAIGLDLRPVELPQTGLLLSEKLASLLNAQRGDKIDVELLEGRRRHVTLTVSDIAAASTVPGGQIPALGARKQGSTPVPVANIVQSYQGLFAYLSIEALNRLNLEGPLVSGVHMSVDESRFDALFARVKQMPQAQGLSLQKVALERFRQTIAQNITQMVVMYTTLAVLMAFGVVYNSARISLSEHARELASLRVLGFTRAEVSGILLGELALLTVLAIPAGWLIGYGIAWLTVRGFDSELFRVPFIIDRTTYAWSAIVVSVSSIVSALIVRRRIDRFDLVSVLKTRE